jgi:hypothetical protein
MTGTVREHLPGLATTVFPWHGTLNLHFTDSESRFADWRTAPGFPVRPSADGPADTHTETNGVALRKLFVTRLVESDYTTEWLFSAELS